METNGIVIESEMYLHLVKIIFIIINIIPITLIITRKSFQIASEYMKQNMSSDGNNLKQIIDEKSETKEHVSDDTLVLHMRVGDVMCSFLPIFKEPYNKQNNVEWWDNIYRIIKLIKLLL
jgi:hypothetical protein